MRLLIFNEYFFPGYEAGGPIQSLSNLVITLIQEIDVFVITSAYDLHAGSPYKEINLNTWNDIQLPTCKKTIKVFYADKGYLTRKVLGNLLKEAQPRCIYLNGVFSYHYFRLPLIAAKKLLNTQVVVCPRGMLQKGALSVKPLKKKVYLFALKLSGLTNNTKWHATNEEEKTDIISNFPVNQGIVIAPNIAKRPLNEISLLKKEQGKLDLVYLSLITQKKNLHLVLQAISKMDENVSLGIYGPIKDESYWKKCLQLIEGLKGRVKYHGSIEPGAVQRCLERYHALVLPTMGENFGHALYESLSVGRPIITSHFTPWDRLKELSAGINVGTSNNIELSAAIKKISLMQQEEYHLLCKGAHALASSYYDATNSISAYKQLFTL